MMVRKLKLTAKALTSLVPPEAGEYSVHDLIVPGFAVRVRASGFKTYFALYRSAGGRRGAVRRYTIGPADNSLPVEKAREEARRVLAQARLGGDPAGDKASKRREWTISELCDAYFEAGANGNKPGTIERDMGRVRRHIVPLIGRKRVREVTQADIERLARAIAQGKTQADVRTKPRGRAIVRGGEGAARRVVGLLGSVFSFAVRQGVRADNPARGIRRGRDGRRERFLSGEELARLGDALRSFETKGANTKAIAAIRLLIFTGARRSEIAALNWNEVDLERGVLALGDSKTGAKAVLLPAPAVAVLSGLERTESPFVFPALEGPSHYQGINKVWRAVRVAAGLGDVRLHDLRHSFASVALARGAALPVIGKLLGHSSPLVTARYAHLAADPVRRAADETGKAIEAAMESKRTESSKPIKAVGRA
jgi:integrase